MDWIDLGLKAFILTMIAIAISIVITFFFPAVSAYIQVAQGSDVFLGETADLSLALSWPDFAIAWCKNAYPGCLPPDQVIQIESNQHTVYIDPDVYHPGWYYRWDGKWNNGENQLAFRVRTGERPSNINVNLTPEPTPTMTGMDIKGNGPFEFIIARGDNPNLDFRYVPYQGTCGTDNSKAKGKLWLFGKTEMLMDIPIDTLLNNEYHIPLNETDTASLSAGVYNGYVQFPGVNGRQDVFYDPLTKCMDTPYDDSVVPDKEVQTFNIAGTKSMFEQMNFDPKYSDDMLIPVTFTIKEAEVIVTDVTQGTDKLWISGITTWWNNTDLKIELDPDNYALAQDKRLHTWTTQVYGEPAAWRRFSQEVPITMEEMYLGMHEIKLTVSKYNRENTVFHNFKITGTFIMPTPTPAFKKYITDVNGSMVLTMPPTPSPTPTPTATPIQVTTYKKTNSTNVTVTETTQARPTATRPPAATTTPVPTATRDPNITIPLPWWIAILSIPIVWRLRK